MIVPYRLGWFISVIKLNSKYCTRSERAFLTSHRFRWFTDPQLEKFCPSATLARHGTLQLQWASGKWYYVHYFTRNIATTALGEFADLNNG